MKLSNIVTEEAESDFGPTDRTLQTQIGPYAMVPLWVIESVDPGPLKLYAYLHAKHGNSEKGIFPGQETIAKRLGVSLATIQRWERELRDAGCLRVEYRGLGKTSVYTIVQIPDSANMRGLDPS